MHYWTEPGEAVCKSSYHEEQHAAVLLAPPDDALHVCYTVETNTYLPCSCPHRSTCLLRCTRQWECL